MLMSIDEWAEATFTAKSRPHDRTIRRWVADGTLPSKKIGGLVFIVDGVDIKPDEKEPEYIPISDIKLR